MSNLPCAECKGKCCTYPVFNQQEYDVVKYIVGIPAEAKVEKITKTGSYDPNFVRGETGYLIHLDSGTCPYLKQGRCSIYSFRPKVCKDYGEVPDLPCQYVNPELARQKQREILERAKGF